MFTVYLISHECYDKWNVLVHFLHAQFIYSVKTETRPVLTELSHVAWPLLYCFSVGGVMCLIIVVNSSRMFTGPCTNLIDEVFTLITKNVGTSSLRVTREQINKIINSIRQVILSHTWVLASIRKFVRTFSCLLACVYTLLYLFCLVFMCIASHQFNWCSLLMLLRSSIACVRQNETMFIVPVLTVDTINEHKDRWLVFNIDVKYISCIRKVFFELVIFWDFT